MACLMLETHVSIARPVPWMLLGITEIYSSIRVFQVLLVSWQRGMPKHHSGTRKQLPVAMRTLLLIHRQEQQKTRFATRLTLFHITTHSSTGTQTNTWLLPLPTQQANLTPLNPPEGAVIDPLTSMIAVRAKAWAHGQSSV